MSDIFRKSVLNRLPAMPPPTKAPWVMDDEELEELEDEQDGLSALPAESSKNARTRAEIEPISASTYFAQALQVQPDSSPCDFRAYYTPCEPHFADKMSGKLKPRPALLVCHHGAGSAGTTFAMMAKEVLDMSHGGLGVLAFDARGHGKTRTAAPASEKELTFSNLQEDLVSLIMHIFPESKQCPDLILLGHSMGASPTISAAPLLQRKGYKVVGVVVLDVVEGTAVESLPLMKSILGQRPTSFRSLSDAIRWHVDSGAIRNMESARISVPALFAPAESEDDSLVWRTDLLNTHPYWEEWYLHLSQHFLEAKSARLLVLAGQERLDKPLMVGQMQGKFQLEVLSDVGHYLHEDKPDKLAALLVDFWKRNTTTLVLPPKMGSASGRNSQPVKMVGDV